MDKSKQVFMRNSLDFRFVTQVPSELNSHSFYSNTFHSHHCFHALTPIVKKTPYVFEGYMETKVSVTEYFSIKESRDEDMRWAWDKLV